MTFNLGPIVGNDSATRENNLKAYQKLESMVEDPLRVKTEGTGKFNEAVSATSRKREIKAAKKESESKIKIALKQ